MSSHTLKIAAAIIVDDEARLLLVRKRGSRYFMQAGGKIDTGETPAEALAREVSEELGVTLTNWEDPVEASAEAANEADVSSKPIFSGQRSKATLPPLRKSRRSAGRLWNRPGAFHLPR
ncbi:NUDIX domain-containing protein [Salinicola sp. 4072]|uniref:NUDIX domain-containing protein n=1 Tax=Salinicola TaxID=404432 RepID=UPI00211ADC1A|nr:NUDIX domain-containing protein [Salinicola salarius]